MTTAQINSIIKEAEGLKNLTQVLTEVSSLRLKRIRRQVEGARAFFTGISSIYGLIKSVSVEKSLKKKGLPAGTVSILLTSNFRFNGHLNNEIIGFFVSQTAQLKTDCIVIGSLAPQIFKSMGFSLPIQNIFFQKDIPSDKELTKLVEKISGYGQILVFYTEFKTVLLQIPTIKDITQTQNTALQKLATKKQARQAFILEPELSKIMQFFDTHIKIALLKQAFLEADLSRVATRLVTMDQAQTNAQEFLDKQQVFASLAKRNYENKKILEAWIARNYKI